MKWLIYLFALACLMLPQGCEEKIITKNLIETTVGQKFSISLDSNPTTGYSWHISQTVNNQIAKLDSSEYLEPETSGLGVGGKEVFNFMAVGRGKTQITMIYFRTWDPRSETEKKVTYNIIVR